MASSQIPLPDKLDSKKPEEWKRWIERFECYRIAAGLDAKDAKVQINTLVYAMGGNANEIFRSFQLAEEDQVYETVKEPFETHFVGRTNVIFERARFNKRVQGAQESVIDFIESLYTLAETCQFGALKDELIRDRIVVGIRNAVLSQKLMQDDTLTLDKAVKQAKSSELVKEHHEILKGDGEDGKINRIRDKKKRPPRDKGKVPENSKDQKNSTRPPVKKCYRCSKSPHKREECPAINATCRKCKNRGHYASECKSKVVLSVDDERQDRNSDEDCYFLGAVENNKSQTKWSVDLSLGKAKMRFKIDTGADVTVIPEPLYLQTGIGNLQKSSRQLFGPGQSKLSVKGVIKGNLKTGNGKESTQEIYVVENLKEPLLGRPAIDALNLVQKVDLVNSDDSTRIEHEVKTMYPNLFKGLGELEGEFSIKLTPGSTPCAITTPRRVALPLMPKVKEELQRMEKLGVISKGDIPTDWCAGMVVVPKPDGRIRICVDLTKLSESVLRETYPLSKIDNLLAQISESKFFTKLDCNSGFWQEKLDPDSRLLTTFITPFGRFCFNRMPFGIKSAPEHYQKKMSQILEGSDGHISIIDDNGKTQEEHDRRLKAVLKRLDGAGANLNAEKCEFSKKEIRFAGYIFNEEGIKSDPEKTESIQDMDTPQNVSDVRRFLGMVNQLGKFVPHLAEKTKPIRDLLNTKNEFLWGPTQQDAFENLKKELTSTPVLAHYDPAKKTILSADASSYGLGAVLLQEQENGTRKPVGYASRSMTSTEQRYAQIEKEALATTWACEKFNDFILGKDILIETDHKPLVPLFGSKNLDELPPRIQRFRMRLMKYSFNICHIPGKDLVIADTLSRAPLRKSPTKTDIRLNEDLNLYVANILEGLPATERRLEEIRLHQQDDEVCRKLQEFSTEGWPDKSKLNSALNAFWPERTSITFQRGLLMKDSRLIIPSSLRLDTLDKIHAGHQGIRKCRERARESVWWPGLSKQIEDMVTTCPTCCKHRKNHAEPMIPTPLPERPWQKVTTDLFYHSGKTYIIVVDYYSRFFEIAPLKSTTTENAINHLKSFFCRHGIPEIIVSDNGPQFAAATFSKFAEECHLTSSPHYPQSNGEVERAVKTAKDFLIKSEDPYLALLSYRSTPLENGYTPAELLIGRKLRSTLPLAPEKLTPKLPNLEHLQKTERAYKLRQAENYNKRHRTSVLPELNPGDKVWIPDKNSPAVVIQKSPQPRSYVVKTEQSLLRRNRRQTRRRRSKKAQSPSQLKVSSQQRRQDLHRA